jgi:hypothetical protein
VASSGGGRGTWLSRPFTGFLALPPAGRPWRQVFGFGGEALPVITIVEQRYKALAFEHHPDRNGGDETKMKELNNAISEARRELQ